MANQTENFKEMFKEIMNNVYVRSMLHYSFPEFKRDFENDPEFVSKEVNSCKDHIEGMIKSYERNILNEFQNIMTNDSSSPDNQIIDEKVKSIGKQLLNAGYFAQQPTDEVFVDKLDEIVKDHIEINKIASVIGCNSVESLKTYIETLYNNLQIINADKSQLCFNINAMAAENAKLRAEVQSLKSALVAQQTV